MKTGRTVNELAAEIERQRDTKRDFVTSTQSLVMDDNLQLHIGDKLETSVNSLTHAQIGDFTKIPAKYYEKMRTEAPGLLADNINTWFKKYPAPRMIRTLDSNARAFLSDRFRPLENSDLLEAVLPALAELKVDIVSCEVTEKRLYIKCVDQKISRDIPKGAHMGDGGHTIFDTICPAMTVSNSEVGFGALSVEVGTLTKACTNLAFFSQRGLKKYHIGGKHDMGEELYRLLSPETRQATDKAVWLQIRDTVKNAFNEARFDELARELQGASADEIEDPVKVVELTQAHFGLNESQGRSILKHLTRGGDLSRYGLFNAVTRTAEDLDDYEDATAFERIGGQIIELPKSEWKRLSAS